jgi:hypothetical protein
MKTVFDELREDLESVDRWIDAYLQGPLPAKEREFAAKAKKYISHCRRDKRRWRSESAAINARIKLKDIWSTLYLRQAQRRLP